MQQSTSPPVVSRMVATSRAELLEQPVVIDLTTPARTLGIGRTRAFDLARRGEFPGPAVRVGTTWRVPTDPLLRLLGLSSDQ